MAPDRAGTKQERARDQYLRLILEHVPGIIWAVDRDLRLTHVQGRLVGIGKLDPGRILGTPVYDLIGTRVERRLHRVRQPIVAPLRPKLRLEKLLELLREPRRVRMRRDRLRRNRDRLHPSPRLREEITRRQRRPQPQRPPLINPARDLRDSPEELRRSVSLLTATFEASADGLLVVDADGNIVS
jgi:PAS domain-containing protein